jgi:O-antigen/teichoic acid export membrane protein
VTVASLTAAILGNVAFTALRFLVILAAGLGTSVLLARALGPEDFGTYRLAMGVIWGLEVVGALAYPSAVTKFTAEFSPREVGRRDAAVLGFFLRRSTLLWAAAAVPLVALAGAIARFYRNEALAPLIVLGAAAVLPGLWSGLLAASMRGRERFRELNVLAVWQAVAGFALTASAVALGARLRGLFVLLLLLNLLNAVLAFAWARGQWAGAPRAALPDGERARLGRYALVMGLIALLGAVIWERSEIFFLGRYSPAEQVGFYSLAYTLALHVRRTLPTPVGEVLFPVFARLQGLGDGWGIANALVHSTRYLAMVACPMALGGFLFAAPLVRLLFGRAYEGAAPVLAILLVSAAAVSLSHPASAVLVNRERYRFLVGSSASLAAASVVLDLLLIPRWAALGAAVANTVVQVAAVAAQMVAAARLLRVHLPVGHILRCLAAAAIALAPALLVRARSMAGDAADLALMAAVAGLAYPVCLRAVGAFVAEDVARLRAIEPMLPAPARWVLVRLVGAPAAARGGF